MSALVGGLVFLFVRTVTIDFRGEAHALSLLRELKDLDARRDVDALRITSGFDASATLSDWGSLRARALRELEKDPARAAVSTQIAAIRTSVAEKETAYQALRVAHTGTLEALKSAEEALASLAAAATPARLRNPVLAATLGAAIERIRAGLRDANIENAVAIGRDLDNRAAALHPAASSGEPSLGDAAQRAASAVMAFTASRAGEAAAWRKFAFTTAGGRIDLASQAASRAIERALDERERWLAYLIAYAAAFALGAAYYGLRAFSELRRLRAANLDLEARASERSRHLGDTLRKLQASEAALVQSEKMSSLGQLLAGVAHEVNAPLGFVRDNLSAARSAMPDLRAAHDHAARLVELVRSGRARGEDVDSAADALAERLRHLRGNNALDTIEALSWDGLKGIEQVLELVSRLRSFSRSDQGHVASFNVNDGVQATLLIAKPLLRKVDVEKALGDVPTITCSPSQVSQVLLNLVTNAAQSIDKPRGRITVTTRPSEPCGIAIDVADNGKGIASDTIGRIFDPFFTTKEGGHGTGLGLSIAHKIVSQHGGRIEVRSEIGVGSTFTVTLPLQPPPRPDPVELTRSAHA